MRKLRLLTLGVALAVSFGVRAQSGEQPPLTCPGFSWDVSAEHALFMTAPGALVAGETRAAAPAVEIGRLVQLELHPASAVKFAAAPGRPPSGGQVYAGLATIKVPRSGAYRISVNQNLWVDVVIQGRRLPALDYEGSRSCDAPHKIVVFKLTSGKTWVLQLSGGIESAARVTVTPAPGAR